MILVLPGKRWTHHNIQHKHTSSPSRLNKELLNHLIYAVVNEVQYDKIETLLLRKN